jgi:hypothetical protein
VATGEPAVAGPPAADPSAAPPPAADPAGSAPVGQDAAADAAEPDAGGEPSPTGRRFLTPVGTVPVEQPTEPAEPPRGQRFRTSVLGDDKLRPAWERKYVD